MTRMKITCSFWWCIVLSEKKLQVCQKRAETLVTVIMKHPLVQLNKEVLNALLDEAKTARVNWLVYLAGYSQ